MVQKITCLIIACLLLTYDGISQYRVACADNASTSSSSFATKYSLFSTSNNQNIDAQTIQELQFLCSRFLVYPIFFFYNDNDGRNAQASEEVLNPTNGPDGTIIFGKRLFNSAFLLQNGSTAIPVIIAHEFAHIVDFKYGVLNHVSSKKRELWADYLAGMYMSLRIRSLGFVDIAATQKIFADMGDTDFGDINHHGTAEERSMAIQTGYVTMETAIQQGMAMPLHTCIEYAKNYINQIEDSSIDEDITPE